MGLSKNPCTTQYSARVCGGEYTPLYISQKSIMNTPYSFRVCRGGGGGTILSMPLNISKKIMNIFIEIEKRTTYNKII